MSPAGCLSFIVGQGMKGLISILFCLSAACLYVRAEPIVATSTCDLLARPEAFNGKMVEVTGRVIVEFECMQIVCLEKGVKQAPLMFGIWLDLDLDSIKQTSPKFYDEIVAGYEEAKRWRGGLRGEMRFRAEFTLSDRFGPYGREHLKDQRWGFGHLGMYGGNLFVKEVLSYQSTLKTEEAQPGATDNPDDAQRLREDH